MTPGTKELHFKSYQLSWADGELIPGDVLSDLDRKRCHRKPSRTCSTVRGRGAAIALVAVFVTDLYSMEQGQQTQYTSRNAAGTVAGKLFLTSKPNDAQLLVLVCTSRVAALTTDMVGAVQHASQLQSLLQFQSGSRYIAGSHNNYQQLEAAKLICKCRHEPLSPPFLHNASGLTGSVTCCQSA